MKKLWLLLAVTSTLLFGCTSDTKITTPDETEDASVVVTATQTSTTQVTVTTTATATKTAKPTETPIPTPTPLPYVMVNPEGKCRTDIEAGVAVLMYGSFPDIRTTAPLFLDRLAKLCVNAFNITFPYYQDSFTASEVRKGVDTPSNEALCVLMEEADKRGFLVTLRPSLDEQSLLPGWRGSIQPANVSAWFASHRELIFEYAALAEKCGGDIISIGFELNSLEGYTDEWMAHINGIRQQYDVKITYAGNWSVRDQVKFWNELDAIGIDQFAGVDAIFNATVEDLTAAWQRQPELIQARQAAETYDHPVVLSEIGVTSQPGSHQRPWIWDHNTSADLEAQRRFYAAACITYSDTVDGIYWWYFGFNEPQDPLEDKTFNVMGKSAEEEILKCYSSKKGD